MAVFESLSAIPANYVLQEGDRWYDVYGNDHRVCKPTAKSGAGYSAPRSADHVPKDVVVNDSAYGALNSALKARGLMICAGPGLANGMNASAYFNQCTKDGKGESFCYADTKAKYGVDLEPSRTSGGVILKELGILVGSVLGGPAGLVGYGAHVYKSYKAQDIRLDLKKQQGAFDLVAAQNQSALLNSGFVNAAGGSGSGGGGARPADVGVTLLLLVAAVILLFSKKKRR